MREIAWDHRTRSWAAKRLMLVAMLTAIICRTGPALAQTFNSGSTGADGAFSPTTNTTLTLPANGVFNFTTINIPAGVTVTFARNAANTPVTLLATGNVTIAGTINLNGGSGGNGAVGTSSAPNGGLGGPGGFDGGDGADGITSTTGGAGLGSGGGAGGQSPHGAGGGSFGTAGGSGGSGAIAPGATYGIAALLPLIGGSGGGGGGAPFGITAGGGGAGGGAILVASSGTITFTGTITAIGGKGADATFGNSREASAGGGGSGGAVRLVANTLTGSGGSITVTGGSGGFRSGAAQENGGSGGIGRIRVEASTNTATITYAQVPSIDKPGALALPGSPSLTITSVAGVAAPASPTGSFSSPDISLPAGTANPMTIALAAVNIPLGTTVTVTVKPLDGAASSATSTALTGTLAASTATASLTIPTNQPSVISASATFTLAALPDAGPLFAQGKQVERIRVAAILGGLPTITYITRSGREVPVDALSGKPLRDHVMK